MSTPAPTTTSANTTRTSTTKILSLISETGDGEPIGFGLLMTPYKADLLDVETLFRSAVDRVEQITRGQSNSGNTQQFIKTATDAIVAKDLNFKGNLFSTKEVKSRENIPRIIFPLPLDIRDQMLVSYQSIDQGIAASFASFGKDLGKNINQGRGLDLGIDTTSSAFVAAMLNYAKGTSVGPLVEQYFGAVANPFTVTAFRNVEPRMFNFEFRITPANQKQSEALQECINTLRFCALPDPTSQGLTLNIPYRFRLAWLGGLKMFDFSEAVLTRIEVNYSSGGSPAFFEFTNSSVGGTPGYHPVAVTIALEFKELFPLTKETILPRGNKKGTYDGEMLPRKIGRNEFDDNTPDPASSPETQGGSTTTDAAENQTGTADNALNTPVSTEAAAVQQAQTTINDSLNKINVLSAELANEGEGGYDAQRAILRQITASDVYLAVNKHDNAVAAYNALIANPSSPSYIQNIPTKKTWLEKVDDGTSGSRTRSFVWYAVYNTGNVDWNKTSGGGP